MKDKGLELVAVNPVDTPEKIRGCLQKGGFTFPILLRRVPGGAEASIFQDLKARAYPMNFLISPEGKILGRWVGFDDATFEEIRAAPNGMGF